MKFILIPCKDLSETEIYAPTFRHGETVNIDGRLNLIVHNLCEKARDLIGLTFDLVSINPNIVSKYFPDKDFDGDIVMIESIFN